MCRLLGIAANRPVDLEFSMFRGTLPFKELGRSNPDGWGLGWYEDGKPTLRKQPISATESEQLQRLTRCAESRIFLAHVRHATHGAIAGRNCHPFKFGNWLFAHNGAVRSSVEDKLEASYLAELQGETDSERLFLWVMMNIEATKDVVSGIRSAVRRLRHYSALNMLLTNGREFYAIRQVGSGSPDYYSLYYLERDPRDPHPEVLRSDETAALLHSKAMRGERAILVCSEKLTGERWSEIPLGSILTVSPTLDVNLSSIN